MWPSVPSAAVGKWASGCNKQSSRDEVLFCSHRPCCFKLTRCRRVVWVGDTISGRMAGTGSVHLCCTRPQHRMESWREDVLR